MKNYGKLFRVSKKVEDEVKRIIGDCKRLGIYLKSQKQAFDLMAMKSYKGQMTKEEIINFLNSIEDKIK